MHFLRVKNSFKREMHTLQKRKMFPVENHIHLATEFEPFFRRPHLSTALNLFQSRWQCGLDMVNLRKSQGAFPLNNFIFISSASIRSLKSFEKLQIV
jgi:hypothetical protein